MELAQALLTYNLKIIRHDGLWCIRVDGQWWYQPHDSLESALASFVQDPTGHTQHGAEITP
jgi:hypothetical protein